MDAVTIRPATESDVAGLVTSHSALAAEDGGVRDPFRNVNWARDHGAEHTKANLANPDRLVLAAEADDEIIGHLLGAYFPPSDMWVGARAYLISMFVHPEWRGHGVGSRLIAHFKQWATDHGAAELRVTAFTANEGAIRLYQRHGFTPLETTLAMPASHGPDLTGPRRLGNFSQE